MKQLSPQADRYHNELDPEVRRVLVTMIDAEPSPEFVRASIARIQQRITRQVDWRGPQTFKRTLFACAASILFLLLCFASSTAAWAEVVQDYQLPANEPKPLSMSGSPVDLLGQATAPKLAHPVMRAVLMAHLFSLLGGLIGMLVAWIATLATWGRLRLGKPFAADHYMIHRRILFASMLVYLAGILLGCCWSLSTWGRLWSWDPREAFCLITIGTAIVWYGALSGSQADQHTNRLPQTSKLTITSTISFGLIVLILLLGGQYTANNRSYGAQSLATIVSVFFTCLASVIWAIDSWKMRGDMKRMRTVT